jgi:Glycogen synthase
LELVKKLGWAPDIIHANDWQTALVPALIKTVYKEDEFFSRVKSVLTVHNFLYGGEFITYAFEITGMPDEYRSEKYTIHNGKMNFLKAGVIFADHVTTVSPGYRDEVLADPSLTGGLDGALRAKGDAFTGVINGIDRSVWNPATDKLIVKNYDIRSLDSKYANKKNLIERFGLTYDNSIPVFSVISRLYNYKGIDLFAKALPDLLKLNIQIVLLGTGDTEYHALFEETARKHSAKFACYLGFNDELAHLIEAGSDFYLMPSKTEPCGVESNVFVALRHCSYSSKNRWIERYSYRY